MSISDSADVPENLQPNFNELLKEELAKLQKEYRLLDIKRHGIAQREGIIKYKTKRILPLLHRNREELTHELINATSRRHQDDVATYSATIKEALQTYDLYQVEIKRKIKHVKQTEKMVDMIIDKVLKQRMKVLTFHGMSKTVEKRERDQQRAEDKLYNLTCSFNMQINANKQLREEINDFLQDRHSFFKVHNHLKRQITLTKRKMLHVVQLAMRSYDNREEAMIKIRVIREREEKDRRQHGMDLQEFQRTVHHDQPMLAFIKIKTTPRTVIEDARKRKARLAATREDELDSILRKYRLTFERLVGYSENKSIHGILEKYQFLDASNFDLVIFLANLKCECEVMREAIDLLKSEIEQADAALDANKKSQRQKQRQLQLEIMAEYDKIDELKAQIKRNKEKMDVILSAIGAAFVLADCNREPVIRLLGNITKNVSVHNVRFCLSILDVKITEMKEERDHLQGVRDNGTVTTNINSTTITRGHIKSSGGPFLPKVTIFHVEAIEEDPKIMEREPYYYDQMREYMHEKMVEEKIINPNDRVVTTSRFSTTKKPGKSLLELSKTRNSDTDVLVRRAKKSIRPKDIHKSASEPTLRLSGESGGRNTAYDLQSLLDKYPARNIFSRDPQLPSVKPSRRPSSKSESLPPKMPSASSHSSESKSSASEKEENDK